MANSNLAQAEQYLKQLDGTLKEIGDQHKLMHDIFSTLQTNMHDAIHILSGTWAKTINLFVATERLRQSLQVLKEVP